MSKEICENLAAFRMEVKVKQKMKVQINRKRVQLRSYNENLQNIKYNITEERRKQIYIQVKGPKWI